MDVSKRLTELFSLEGKVSLVTGAGGSICGAMAKCLAEVGSKVVLADLAGDAIEALAAEIEGFGGEALPVVTDVSSLDSIKQCVDAAIGRFGKIDVLINGAGINKRVWLLDGDEETFERIVAVNLKGTHFMSQAVARHMKEQGGGSIINLTSYNNEMMLGGCGVYGATKSGVEAFTRAQAVEWARYGIRSNAIAPGHIKTNLTVPTWNDPEKSKYLLDRIAMARPGVPEDMLGATVLLASDASGYMSGKVIHVDGGCLAGGQPWNL